MMHQSTDLSPVYITSYDVLIAADGNERMEMIGKDHVGNRRVQVFLSLHRDQYCNAKLVQNQEEMDYIVDSILDIICSKCIRQGRFLERVKKLSNTSGEEWMDLERGPLARRWLHQALSEDAVEERSVTANLGRVDDPLKNSTNSLKRQRRGSHHAPFQHQQASSALTIMECSKGLAFEEKNIEGVGLTSSSSSFSGDQNVVRPMDVIFVSHPKGLAPTGNPGNARLQIMIDIHSSSFASGDTSFHETVVDDIKHTVKAHWNGRFLLQRAENILEEISSEAASAFIQALLLQDSASELADGPLSSSLSITSQCNSCKRTITDGDDLPSPKLSSINDNDRTADLSSLTLFEHMGSENSFASCASSTASGPNGSDHESTNDGLGTSSLQNNNSLLELLRPSYSASAESNLKLRKAAISFLKAQKKKRAILDRFYTTNK